MFKIEDIAMMIKSFSEKRLRKTLKIKDMSFDESLSHELDDKSYRNRGHNESYVYMIFFKIKQTVNQEEFTKKIYDSVKESLAEPLDLYYESKYYIELQIKDSFRINQVNILSKNGSFVGIRGNVNYIKLEIQISDGYQDNIMFKVKQVIRDLKMSQLRI